jgi:hypothetical protein
MSFSSPLQRFPVHAQRSEAPQNLDAKSVFGCKRSNKVADGIFLNPNFDFGDNGYVECGIVSLGR